MTLFSHQEEIIEYIQANSKTVLAIEMGRGSNTAIAKFMADKKQANVVFVSPMFVNDFCQKITNFGGEVTKIYGREDFFKKIKGTVVIANSLTNIKLFNENFPRVDNLAVINPVIKNSESQTYREIKTAISKTERIIVKAVPDTNCIREAASLVLNEKNMSEEELSQGVLKTRDLNIDLT